MRLVYSFLLYISSPFFILRLWLKGRKSPDYKARIWERFACFKGPDNPIDYWFHAVSLGEVNASIPLIDAMINKHPNATIAITTMTPTGSSRVKNYYGDKVFHVYLPYDMPFTVRRFLNQLKPKRSIIMETELWPNLIYYCRQYGIPTMLANARLSPQSFGGYRKLKFIMKSVLNRLSLVVAQSEEDGQRFLQLGLLPAFLKVVGNIKFDIEPAKFHNQAAKQLQLAWGLSRPVLIVASTHHDEESQVLTVFESLKKDFPDLILLLAPRHPERFDEVTNLCQQQGFAVSRRSEIASVSEQSDIVIIDCIGELMAFFSIATVAFIGGSFVPVGGHNVLEPISVGVPTLSGPYYFNFKAIIDQLLSGGGVIVVENTQQLIREIKLLISDKQHLKQLVSCANQILSNNKGTIEQYIKLIDSIA